MSRDRARGSAQYYGAASTWSKWTAVLGVVLFGATSLMAQTFSHPNRIKQEISAKPMVELSGTVHPLTAKAADLGAVDSNLQLNSLTLNIAPSVLQKNQIEALQESLQDPQSPRYHKWLTQAEYGARFGLTDADLGQLTSWLKSQGFIVKGVSTSRNAISFSGKVWQVESALHTQLHNYNLDGEPHFANASSLHIPAQFDGVVLNVRGLSDFRPKANTRRIPVSADYTRNSGSHYLSPADWATIYNVNEIYSAGFDGTAMHVGVMGQSYAPQSDIDNFRSAAGLSATQLTYHCISTTVNCTDTTSIVTGDLAEADLDIEWAGGIAKNATVDYIYASGADVNLGVFDALQYAIQTYKAANGSVLPVISMSYSSCITQLDATNFALIDTLGRQASLQGQTLVVSSGDSGAAGCDAYGDPTKLTATHGLSVQVPADSPNFTSVGGTTFSGDDSNPAAYWVSQAGLVNSAIQYIPETSWNETDFTGIAASGGGESESAVSTILSNGIFPTLPQFPQPTWQNGLIPNTTGRLVPDIAFAAAAGHDGYLNCSSDFNSQVNGTMCANGFYSSGAPNGSGSLFYSLGGTSASAPSFAGMLTLIVQRYGPQGNLNPVLYQLAKNTTTYPAVFNDVTKGSNQFACLAGTNGCVGGLIGYLATANYDQVTGLGSINGGGLFTALPTAAQSATDTKVAVTPTSVAFGSTVTLTATVTPATSGKLSGPVTFTISTPTITLGTAPITVDAITGVATATLSIAATGADGLKPGSYTIIATYSGGPGYLPSTSPSATLAVTGFGDTKTTVSASPNALAIGGSTTLTATVISTIPGPITGTVAFNVGSTTIGTGTVSGGTATSNVTLSTANGFSVSPYSITAIYSGDANYAPSTSPSTTLTVTTAAAGPTYTFSTSPTSVGGSSSVVLTLNSTGYAGTVSFATSVSSTTGTTSNVTASAPSITLVSDGTGTSTLAITASANAANQAPTVPWKCGGAIMFATVLLGAPFTTRRKRVPAVLLTALTISLAGFLIACNGFFVDTASTAKSPRVYTVTVTPTGSGTVTNPGAVSITVTVP